MLLILLVVWPVESSSSERLVSTKLSFQLLTFIVEGKGLCQSKLIFSLEVSFIAKRFKDLGNLSIRGLKDVELLLSVVEEVELSKEDVLKLLLGGGNVLLDELLVLCELKSNFEDFELTLECCQLLFEGLFEACG